VNKTGSSGGYDGYDYSSPYTVESSKEPAGEGFKVYTDWGAAEHANDKDTPYEPAKNCYSSGSTEPAKPSVVKK